MSHLRSISEILELLSARAPLTTAEDWDNVGLLIGDPKQQTKNVVISNDLTFEAIETAVHTGAKLIVNHHPCIFPKGKGLSRILSGAPYYEALRKEIAVIALHTNFDRCSLEVVEAVSQGLGVKPKGRLLEHPSQSLEEISSGIGYGFWGDYSSPKPFADFAKDVKDLFNIHAFWITAPAPSQVSRIGFVAGKGASFVEVASSLKCDVFLTGEAGYHTALLGARLGTAVLEMGHRESEKFFGEVLKIWLSSLGLGITELKTPTQTFWQEVIT